MKDPFSYYLSDELHLSIMSFLPMIDICHLEIVSKVITCERSVPEISWGSHFERIGKGSAKTEPYGQIFIFGDGEDLNKLLY